MQDFFAYFFMKDDQKQGFYIYQFIILTGYMGGIASVTTLVVLAMERACGRCSI